jgi:hypothetical protein
MRTRRVRGRLVGEKPAGVHVGQVRAEGRGQTELPSPRPPPASPRRTGLAQSIRWRARLPAAHPTRGCTSSLRCSGCSTRGSRFRSSHGFLGATPPWSRRARRRRDRRIQTVSYPSRSANLLAAEPLPERGAPPSSKTRGTSPRGPAEPPVAVPANRLRLSQRVFSGTQAQFLYWADNSSKQAGAWIFGDFASMTRSRTWVMEMRFVTRCTTTTSLR